MTTLRFVVELSVELDEQAASEPFRSVALADELQDALMALDQSELPSWVFSVDGVDPAP